MNELRHERGSVTLHDILYIKWNVYLHLIQIHFCELIGTKLCTHLPLRLEETVGNVWSENV